MDKKSKETIKEIIEDILIYRDDEIKKANSIIDMLVYKGKETLTQEDIKNRNTNKLIEKYDITLIKLNNLLKYNERNKEVIEIEKQMTKIQAKKYITVKEFTEIYNISKSSQQDYRGRLYDPLPFHQKVSRGKIVYVVEEVEKWFDNQHK